MNLNEKIRVWMMDFANNLTKRIEANIDSKKDELPLEFRQGQLDALQQVRDFLIECD